MVAPNAEQKSRTGLVVPAVQQLFKCDLRAHGAPRPTKTLFCCRVHSTSLQSGLERVAMTSFEVAGKGPTILDLCWYGPDLVVARGQPQTPYQSQLDGCSKYVCAEDKIQHRSYAEDKPKIWRLVQANAFHRPKWTSKLHLLKEISPIPKTRVLPHSSPSYRRAVSIQSE